MLNTPYIRIRVNRNFNPSSRNNYSFMYSITLNIMHSFEFCVFVLFGTTFNYLPSFTTSFNRLDPNIPYFPEKFNAT